jgi:hypothetical protein
MKGWIALWMSYPLVKNGGMKKQKKTVLQSRESRMMTWVVIGILFLGKGMEGRAQDADGYYGILNANQALIRYLDVPRKHPIHTAVLTNRTTWHDGK